MLSERLQILLDPERMRRLQEEAARRRLPVAVVVRDAIDAALPPAPSARADAAAAVLGAAAMPVPGDPGDLRAELEDLRGRHG